MYTGSLAQHMVITRAIIFGMFVHFSIIVIKDVLMQQGKFIDTKL